MSHVSTTWKLRSTTTCIYKQAYFELIVMDVCLCGEMDVGMSRPETIYDVVDLPVNVAGGAFKPYRRDPAGEEVGLVVSPSGSGNANKRMVELLRKRARTGRSDDADDGKGRSYRHMINERQRREKMRQSYSELHSLLPPGSKTDKNSIVQMAAQELQQLQEMKEELERQHEELRSRVEEKERGLSKVRIRVTNPSSPVDSIVEVLKCLTRMNVKAKDIGSEFSDGEFSAIFEIEGKTPGSEIEKSVDAALMEVERKFSVDFQEGEDF